MALNDGETKGDDPADGDAAVDAPTPKGEESSSQVPPTRAKPFVKGAVGGAPSWVVPLYIVGLVLVFSGERAFTAMDSLTWVFDGLGVGALLFATLVRFSPKFVAKGERASIEKLMRALSLVGLLAILVYFATTEWGQQRLGLAAAAFETRERVLGVLSVTWIALVLVAAVPMLFAEASLLPMRRASVPESRRVKAAATAGLSLALTAVYASLFVFAADGANIRVDYSYFKTAGPSESTKKIAQDLEDQVQVTAFFPDVNEVKSEVQGFLSELAKGAPKLKLEVTDRLLEPKKAEKLRATQDGVVVLSQGETHRSLVIGTEMEKARPRLKTLDKDFQEQLVKLARSRRTVYLSVGHGELNDGRGTENRSGRSARIAKKLLEKQNYTVKDLGIAQGLAKEVPDDADIVMVLGPTEPFVPEELGALKRFVARGGKLFLALDPDAVSSSERVDLEVAPDGEGAPAAGSASPANGSEVPALATDSGADGFGALSELVGLKYSPILLANEQRHIRRRFNNSDRIILATSSFSSHASVSTLSRNAPRAAVVVSGAGSLTAAGGSKAKVDFTVRSAPGTFADANRDFAQDKATERDKSFNLAAAVSRASDKPAKSDKVDTKAKSEKKKGALPPGGMRAFVLADADALSDMIMSNVPANQVLFFDAVRWLGGEESWLGEQSNEEDIAIEHTKKEDQIWFYSTIFGAPALVLGAGVWISRRSRRRSKRGAR